MSDELSQANNRGFELGRRHAALADVIGQAALWASSFGVSTAEVLPDGSVFMTYPLSQHADYLVELWRLLGGACVNLASSFEGRMSAQDVSVTPLSHEAAIQSPTYVIGADFVHVLQSRSAHRSTFQDLWRNEVTNAAMYLSVCGIRTDGLERYAAISQALFDDASTVVREAYAHSVAVTYGRIWARASQANEGRVLMAWMKALADGGFSFEECILELRDLKVASPEAVSSCLNSKSAWLHEEE